MAISTSKRQAASGHPIDEFDTVRISPPDPLRRFLLGADLGSLDEENAQVGLKKLIRDYLDSGTGMLVLTGLPATIKHGRRAVERITHLLGTPLPQDRLGTIIREVRDRGTAIGEGLRTRYSDSRFGGDLHTDGAESPLPAPDAFVLFCVRQAGVGGALEIVHIKKILEALDRRPEILDILRSPFHFDRRGDELPGESSTTSKPILFEQQGRPAITYLRTYIERGHQSPGAAPLNAQQIAALNALDEVLRSRESVKTGKLREGELAIFDNLSLVHGRTEFRDDCHSPRLLLRSWIRRSLIAPGD